MFLKNNENEKGRLLPSLYSDGEKYLLEKREKMRSLNNLLMKT
jgi:hypothetical protein